MKTYHGSDIRRRILGISFVFIAWFVVLAGRLFELQIVDHRYYREVVKKQNREERAIPARRGNIYDRNGRMLASSTPIFSVAIRPLDNETAAQERDKLLSLKPVLGLTNEEIAATLSSLHARRGYTYVKKRLRIELRQAVLKLKLKGIEIEDGHTRTYPLGRLASHVLGGVDADERGRAGVERSYDALLSGQPGRQIVSIDSRRREYETQIVKAPVPGADVVLTIDADIQYIAECELARALTDHSAACGTVIILEPATGEILAMASLPDFGAGESPSREAWMNRAYQYVYEPGSTFKIVTAAAALEKGVVSYGDSFDCRTGSITIGSLRISDHEQMGVLTFPQVLIHSSNVGTVMFATRMAQADFYTAIRKFGFGEKTGIDLPAEENGRVRPLAKWNKLSSLPHVAIGYEVLVTPLQILRAMNVYATGGLLVRPRVVRQTPGIARAGSAQPASDAAGPGQRILDASLASGLVDRAFERVVEEGTGKDGRLDSFPIAGKTGTAQIYDQALGGYTSHRYVASFVGFVPVDRPVLSMIVVLGEPKDGFYYGGQVCAPVFRDIAARVLRYLRVKPERAPAPGKVVSASLQGKGRT